MTVDLCFWEEPRWWEAGVCACRQSMDTSQVPGERDRGVISPFVGNTAAMGGAPHEA